jgi:hypothetical protein
LNGFVFSYLYLMICRISMAIATNLGFPRIGAHRELKKALESDWKGESERVQLQQTAAQIRQENWQFQQQWGIQLIPSNDFSLHDQVLDAVLMVGAIPPRYNYPNEIGPGVYEVAPSLQNLVTAAQQLRQEIHATRCRQEVQR